MNQHADAFLAQLRARDLADLRWHWDGAYEIAWDGRFRARRRDGLGTLDTSTALELREHILHDYLARPVPRSD